MWYLISHLQQEFSMTDLGSLHHFLGIAVTRDNNGLFLSQRQYSVDLLNKAGMLDCQPSRTPVRKKIRRGCCENNIIYIKKKIGNLIVRVVNKKGIIRTRGRKTDGLNEVRKTLKPGTGSLF
jgi:hypothetical protein